jgi:phenylalanyl-tRNA synthetase beta subunit
MYSEVFELAQELEGFLEELCENTEVISSVKEQEKDIKELLLLQNELEEDYRTIEETMLMSMMDAVNNNLL